MKSLYEILGIDPGSDDRMIKKAYRSKAQTEHPDKGGNEEDFHEITTAYSVLSNPERRKKYNETGDTEEPCKKDPVESTLAGLFELIINQDSFSGDIIDGATQFTKKEIASLETQSMANNQKKRKFEKLLPRVISKSEINLFTGLLNQKIDNLNHAIEQANEHIEIMGGVLELLKNYEDIEPELQTVSFAKSSTFFSTSTTSF